MSPSGKNKSGKMKCAPLQKIDDEPTTCTSNDDQEEVKQNFEIELCWCIEQLQKGLKAGKLNKKQIQDHVKALNILMSNSTPIPQKRQVMRLSLGDYRAKMAAEEKKYSGKISAKIIAAKPDSKSTFVKKSTLLTMGDDFKFKFDLLNVKEYPRSTFNDILKDNKDKEAVEIDTITNRSDFKFIPSNNTFKFSFNVD